MEQIEGAFLSNMSRFWKERCFLEASQASPVCICSKTNIQMEMSVGHQRNDVEHWWNDTARGKPNSLIS